MQGRKKTPWQMRLEFLQSLSLDRVVEEINRERFAKLLQLLAAPSGREARRMTRLMRLYETDQLRQLPTDQRASAGRMKRVLIGLHRQLGNHAVCVVDIPRLASNSGVEPDTCERAIRDLHDGKLIFGDRERQRARRSGGQGWSSYGIVWSTVADLALCQGAQRTLFNLPPPNAGALPHCAGALPHETAANFPNGRSPRAHADASFLRFFSKPSSPSPPSPADPLSQGTPSANLAEPHPAKSEQEKKKFLAGDWERVAGELVAYGVYSDCLRAARDRGWSPDQVRELVAACLLKSVGHIRAWGPGLVFRHLQLAPPGTPIRMAPCEAYVRAKRDDDLRLERIRQAARQEAENGAAIAREASAAAAEEEAAALFDAAPDDVTAAIREAVLLANPILRKLLREHRDAGERWLRREVIKELKARAAAREATSQEDQT